MSLAPSTRYWRQFCNAIDIAHLENDPRFDTVESRMENQSELLKILEALFCKKTLVEWSEQLASADLLWSPIKSPKEVLQDPQLKANDYIVPFDHPELDTIEVPANPIQHSKTPASLRTPAPEFSQHTEEILLEIGYTCEDIEELKDEGIIA